MTLCATRRKKTEAFKEREIDTLALCRLLPLSSGVSLQEAPGEAS